jgi:5-methylcytosine-specific restriction endonuclease McrA
VLITRAPVLVLNQNYQPLNICNVRRAVALLGKGKAEPVGESGEYLHSADDLIEKPIIIRLFYMVKRPLHRRKLSRREVFVRDGYRCQYCGMKSRDLTLDHVLPRSRGGAHAWDNIVSACKPCNHGKAGRTPREAGMRLFSVPREPRPNPYAMFHPGRVLDEWRPFLPWVQSSQIDDFEPSLGAAAVAGGD